MITLKDIIPWILGSSVLTAILTQLFKWLSDHFLNKTAKETHALYAAVALEEFIVFCATVITDMAEHYRTEGQYGRLHKELPNLVDFRSAIDLKGLPRTIRSKLLTLTSKINMANSFIVSDERETRVYSTEIYAAKLGADALSIANAIRMNFGLNREENSDFDRAKRTVVDELKRQSDHLHKMTATMLANVGKEQTAST